MLFPWLMLVLWRLLMLWKMVVVTCQGQWSSPRTKLLEISGEGNECRKYQNCAACTNAHYPSIFVPDDLNSQKDIAWPHRRPSCEWCPSDRTCYSTKEAQEDSVCVTQDEHDDTDDSKTSKLIIYEYDCPLGPDPYPDQPPELLPDWMGTMMDVAPERMEELRLVDWSLPGTHDSLTYDLSTTISDDGLDDFERLADILHALSGNELLPGELEEFFRLQAKTQQLTITQQLDNGIRFIDLRLMMEHDSHEWYSIHFMQSRQEIHHYFKKIRSWLDVHPKEIVVIWLSKHGSTEATGEGQYPGVTLEEKQALWQTYQDVFDGLMLDTRQSDLYITPVAELIRRKHRVVTFASDYVEFTDSSPWAVDAAAIQNFCNSGVFDEVNTMGLNVDYLNNAAANNAANNAESRFTLMSMNTSGPSWQLVDAAKHRFLHWILEEHALELQSWFHSCASKTHIPGLTSWCPETLLDIVQLTSYYNHVILEGAWIRLQVNDDTGFPNAFYIDGLDYDGTIRTGTQLLDGLERSQSDYKGSKYAYVDTVLAYNARKLCAQSDEEMQPHCLRTACVQLTRQIENRRSKYPVQVWDEPKYGRHRDWPFGHVGGFDSVIRN